MMKLVFACLLLVACDTGGGGGMGLMPDAAPGTPKCTGALYDWCANAAGCMSGMCHFYEKSNFTVCTQACSASNPCPPDSTGAAATCNNNGRCKPAKPNPCTL